MKLTSICAASALLSYSNAAFSSFSSRSFRTLYKDSHISTADDQSFRSTSTRLNYAQTTLPDSSDPYVLLDLDPSAVDLKTIKKAYRKMALKYHPDTRSAVDRQVANEEFARVNAAYAFLIGKSEDIPSASSKTSTKHKSSTTKHKNQRQGTSQPWYHQNQNTYSNYGHNSSHNDFYRKVKIHHQTSTEYSSTSTGRRNGQYSSYEYSEEKRQCESQGRPYTQHNATPNEHNVYSYDHHGNPVNGNNKSNRNHSQNPYIRDFAQHAQVRNFDVHGNPIDEPKADYSSQTSSTGHSNANSSENHSNQQTSQSSSFRNPFRDFATHAQVRNYDSNGNPINNHYSNVHSHAYRAMYTYMQNEAYAKQVAQNDLDDAFAKAGFQSHTVSTPSADNVVSFDIHGNPVSRKYDPSTYSSTNQKVQNTEAYKPSAANVQAYDIHGNPVSRSTATRMYEGWGESDNISWSAPYSYAPNLNKDASTVSWSDTVVDTSSYVPSSHAQSSESCAPSPSRVQGYDIYGNPVDRNAQPTYNTHSQTSNQSESTTHFESDFAAFCKSQSNESTRTSYTTSNANAPSSPEQDLFTIVDEENGENIHDRSNPLFDVNGVILKRVIEKIENLVTNQGVQQQPQSGFSKEIYP
jgi:hypothetical protein